MQAKFRFQYLVIPLLFWTDMLHAAGVATWYKPSELPTLLALVILSSAIIYFIVKAKAGEKLYIRRIPALNSIDEAIGRATEMGRAAYFIPGIMDIDDIQTLAGLNILGNVARTTANYDCDLKVPVSRSMVLGTAQEVVKESYLRTGHPDLYQESNLMYITDDQFAFAAGVNGMFVREKPAAVFMLGMFYAESLLLAETGNSIGAIQVAGTAEPSQLPFFVAACDYVLIGEELFAASAYLSKEPRLLGSLKGQDVGKFIIIFTVFAGSVLEISIRIFGLSEQWSVLNLF
ncbi:DUF6754 domain-containing protein [Candidatus Riflebacteria bacterium]